ncbi:MAG: fatty acid desaturase [Leptolyngbya sp. SIO1E4]|nr:fatty acid desaturase [Leptolyngbya sp. SIO1E4]
MSALIDRSQLQPVISRHKPLWNGVAIAYTLLSYLAGLTLMVQPSVWLNTFGVLLLTHSLVYSAYFTHEFFHGSIFVGRRWNAIGGTLMLWLNGGCYVSFNDLAKCHIAHHVDRVDFSGFDLVEALQALPQPIRWVILGLEWLYFPIISFWLQWRSVLKTWQRPDQRLHIALTLVIRGILFTLLGWISLKALVLYFIAHISMVNLLRWMDAFQHTYEVLPVGTPVPLRSREHEQANTFSTLISSRYRWLNLLLLNAGYHNAHHEVMQCPWHSLSDLDSTLFNGDEVHYVPLSQLLLSYHRFRIKRIFLGQGQGADENRQPTPDLFYGAVGVSFLTVY